MPSWYSFRKVFCADDGLTSLMQLQVVVVVRLPYYSVHGTCTCAWCTHSYTVFHCTSSVFVFFFERRKHGLFFGLSSWLVTELNRWVIFFLQNFPVPRYLYLVPTSVTVHFLLDCGKGFVIFVLFEGRKLGLFFGFRSCLATEGEWFFFFKIFAYLLTTRIQC